MFFPEKGQQLADEAKRKGYWLYEPSYNKWYTPEDFTAMCTYVDMSDEFFNKIEVRDPKEAIAAGFKKPSEVQGRLEGFVKRVGEYYGKGK